MLIAISTEIIDQYEVELFCQIIIGLGIIVLIYILQMHLELYCSILLHDYIMTY